MRDCDRLLFLLVWVIAATATQVTAAADPFARCQEQMRAAAWNSCGCFYSVGVQSGELEAAERRLVHLLELESESACARFNLGRLGLLLARPDAFDLLRRAAEGFQLTAEAEGETYARLNASRAARRVGDDAEASRQLFLARDAAARTGDALLTAQVELQSIRLALADGEDLDDIERRLAALEERAPELGSPSLWREILQARGNVAYLLSRFEEAAGLYQRMAERCAAEDDRYGESTALLNRIIARSASGLGPTDRGLLRGWLEEALSAAVAAGQRQAEAEIRLRLYLIARTQDPAKISELESVVALARDLGAHEIEARALAALAAAHLEVDPAKALHLAQASEDLARESPHYGSSAYGWSDRMEVMWRSSSFEQAMASGLLGLDQVEAYRLLQRAAGQRAEAFAVWTEIFYALSGRFLAAATGFHGKDLPGSDLHGPDLLGPSFHGPVLEGESRRQALEAAFQTIERMRARVLLESLESLEAVDSADDPARDAAGESNGDSNGVLEGVKFVSLDELQRALGPRRALLSFQIAPWQNVYGTRTGGSWLNVVTAAGVSVYPLPGREKFDSSLRVYLKLLERRDGSDSSAARRFHADLLDRALAELPEHVEHLILVADGPLHRMPFARLLDDRGQPLAWRFSLATAPSATFWARSQVATTAMAGSVLVMAAPDLPPGARLENLPGARREAQQIRKRFAGRILEGSEASESMLGELDWDRFNILHFATHAVVDTRRPERSRIALSAGAGDDGWLHPAEIAGLDLGQRLVVLAACRGADGRVLAGEGPMSLARAFFQAGASTVLASQWPLRDDEAASLFADFYAGLAFGLDASASLARAQKKSQRRGEPAAAWAGLVVLGDGEATFEPRLPPFERWLLRILSFLAIVAMVVAASAFWWFQLRDRSLFSSPWQR